jgi:hypothetical protein
MAEIGVSSGNRLASKMSRVGLVIHKIIFLALHKATFIGFLMHARQPPNVDNDHFNN